MLLYTGLWILWDHIFSTLEVLHIFCHKMYVYHNVQLQDNAALFSECSVICYYLHALKIPLKCNICLTPADIKYHEARRIPTIAIWGLVPTPTEASNSLYLDLIMGLVANRRNMADFLLEICTVIPEAYIFVIFEFGLFAFPIDFFFSYLLLFSIGTAKCDWNCSILPSKWSHKGVTEEIDFHFSSIFLNCVTYFAVKEDASLWIFCQRS